MNSKTILLPDWIEVWVPSQKLILSIPSRRGHRTWQVTVERLSDGHLHVFCECEGWTYHGRCHHLVAVADLGLIP